MFPSALYVIACIGFMLLQSAVQIHGHSHPMDLCSLTREGMIRGMGGGHLNLGYTLTSKGTTVMLQMPENGSLKGLYLYATDEAGNNVGTWETETAGFQPIVSTTCNGGGITHLNAQVKAASSTPTFKLTLPDNVESATVKGFVVQAKTTWQELDPITVTADAKSVEDPNEGSFLTFKKSSLCLLQLILFFLLSFPLI